MSEKQRITSQPALFSAMVVLFFIWGFITLLNDLLVPVLRQRLHLNYAEANLVQFAFFFTYFVMSIPMAKILNRFEYKKSIMIGLAIIAVGCIIFVPADLKLNYPVFLIALFVLASGIVMLQVSANPLVTLLGDDKTSSARLTLAQGLNSLGTFVAPLLVSGLILHVSIYTPYIIIAVIMLLTILFISRFNFQSFDMRLRKEEESHMDATFPLWQHFPFVLGLVAIFSYVGAEVSAGSLLISYLTLPDIANFTIEKASTYLSIYWGGAMVGRLIGSYILTKISPAWALTFNAFINVLLLFGVTFATGHFAMYSLLLLGLFNSIMFPTIFSLAISYLPYEHLKNRASGFLVMAIVGGAIVPVLQGLLADRTSLQFSFILLTVFYALICAYGLYIKNYKNPPFNLLNQPPHAMH